MKNARRQDGVGLALFENVDHVIEIARAAAGHDGDAYVFADAPGDLDVVAGFGAVSVDAV